MKVRMLQGFSGSVGGVSNPRAGQVVDVGKAVADDLISRGKAEKVKRETAAKSPPEAAMQPKAEPREETFECDDCGRTFDSPQGLGSHGRVHAG